MDARLISAGGSVEPQRNIYLDDYLFRDVTSAATNLGLNNGIQVCKDLGLGVSTSKLVWATTRTKHLGYVIDSSTQTVEVSSVHRDFALAAIGDLLRSGRTSRKKFHSLCGLLSYLAVAVFASRPYLRPFWTYLRTLRHGRRPRKLPGDLVRDLKWWQSRLQTLDATSPWVNPASSPVEIIMTDASGDVGCGVWWGRRRFRHLWTASQLQGSVPYKELWPIVRFVRRFGSEISRRWGGKRGVLVVRSDSLTNTYSVNAGSSSSPACARLLRELASLQRRYGLWVLLSWTPREKNVVADLLSKFSLSGEPLIVPSNI